jgi:hypothetical protein
MKKIKVLLIVLSGKFNKNFVNVFEGFSYFKIYTVLLLTIQEVSKSVTSPI